MCGKTVMTTTKHIRAIQRERGAALILALALMAIMAVMGTYYVRHMNLEQEAADIALAEMRARLAADAGVQATLGKLAAALRSNAMKIALAGPDRIELPTYQLLRGAQGLELAAHERRRASADVVVFDENARLNLNAAPADVLTAALGIAPDVAQRIAEAPGLPKAQGGGPFLAPEDLVARGLMTRETFEKLDQSLITTYSAPDPTKPDGCLNVNTASPKVLAAALGIDEAAAKAAQEKGPFRSLDAFSQVVGKDVSGVTSGGTPMPARAFDCESRCFRIISTGAFARVDVRGNEYHRALARVEAVVIFDKPSVYRIISWNSES